MKNRLRINSHGLRSFYAFARRPSSAVLAMLMLAGMWSCTASEAHTESSGVQADHSDDTTHYEVTLEMDGHQLRDIKADNNPLNIPTPNLGRWHVYRLRGLMLEEDNSDNNHTILQKNVLGEGIVVLDTELVFCVVKSPQKVWVLFGDGFSANCLTDADQMIEFAVSRQLSFAIEGDTRKFGLSVGHAVVDESGGTPNVSFRIADLGVNDDASNYERQYYYLGGTPASWDFVLSAEVALGHSTSVPFFRETKSNSAQHLGLQIKSQAQRDASIITTTRDDSTFTSRTRNGRYGVIWDGDARGEFEHKLYAFATVLGDLAKAYLSDDFYFDESWP